MKKIAAIISTVLLLSHPLPCGAADGPDAEAPASVLVCASADVTGDGRTDTVCLTGRRLADNSRFVTGLVLVVNDGLSGETLTLALDMAGYDSSLFTGDFTGDGVPDVLVRSVTGGSGGIVDSRIATFADSHPAILFGPRHNRGSVFTGQFLDGWKTELLHQDTGRSVIIGNSHKRDDYVRLGIYDEAGKRRPSDHKPWSNPFSRLEPAPSPERPGVYELKGWQRIPGAYNADTLAAVESQWYYYNGDWLARRVDITIRLADNP